ncbi:phage/plasmid primase, P4 family [Streptomyces turgidiscabies]|uniref:phage/plasmid primase, P4 family n=1 Tax=Streptomyces turgidiscabies TaxID=85558 RepID=UPI0038F6FECF
MSEQEWPAFRPEFEGHIGSTTGNEPNDKSNGKRMADLYGAVFRYLEDGDKWMVWKGTHWGQTKQIIRQAAHDMSDYMDMIEVPNYEPLNAPEFPDGWNVVNRSLQPYKALLGRYGALLNDPEKTMEWAAKSSKNGEFLGERLAYENKDKEFQAQLGWVEKSKDSARITAAIKEAAAREEFEAGIEDFDTVPNTFTVLNGQLNTVTGELEEHRLDDLNTRLCPLEYKSGAKCPEWTKYMETSHPNEDTRRYIQKAMGYAISGDFNQKLILFMFSEEGDTGRSLFFTVMDRVLGSDYSLPLAPGTLEKRKFDDGGRNPDREQIRGKRVAHTSELDPDIALDERFLKQISGRDTSNTRGNYSREGNTAWTPECLVVIATNHLIRLKDEVIWNRVQVVPWTQSFPKGHKKRDEDLQDKILGNEAKGYPGEVEGVLAWIKEGLDMYRADKGLIPPEEVELATLAYKSDGDSVQKWLAYASGEGDIELGDEMYDKATPLNKMYKAWARAEGFDKPLGLSAFNKRMTELGFRRDRPKNGQQYAKQDCTFGLRINPNSDAFMKFVINKEQN